MFLRLGRFKLILFRPQPRVYGILAVDVLTALHTAKKEKALLYFVKPRKIVSRAVFEIRSRDVQILAGSKWIDAPLAVVWGKLLARQNLQRIRSLERRIRGFRRGSRDSGKAGGKSTRNVRGDQLPYFRRSLFKDPISAYLPESKEKEAAGLAAEVGISPEARVVTLHVRQEGFRQSVGGRPERDYQAARNARIETYFKAIDSLVSRGYTVVRVGDTSMTPVSRQGVVDIATLPQEKSLLELYCLMRSSFFIGCDSGPNDVCNLTNTPSVVVNSANPIGSYPVRRGNLQILKHVVDGSSGRTLSLAESLTEGYLLNMRDSTRYEYIDDDDDEILQAVLEMEKNLANGPQDTPAQQAYHGLLCKAATELRDRVPYIGRYGPDNGFMGDGRIASFFAERYLYAT